MSGNRIGKVTHYFDRTSVAVLEVTDVIRVGDTLHFLGHATDFKQEVKSEQIKQQNVDEVKPEWNYDLLAFSKATGFPTFAGPVYPRRNVALKVALQVHPKDEVFKITKEE
jgi:hypothetical protein